MANYNVPIHLYLGVRHHTGDLASVVVEILSPTGSASATGRLLALYSGVYGLEIRFDKFPSASLPPGTTISVNKLDLSVGAARTVKTGKDKHRRRKRYALIITPPTCNGAWTASSR